MRRPSLASARRPLLEPGRVRRERGGEPSRPPPNRVDSTSRTLPGDGSLRGATSARQGSVAANTTHGRDISIAATGAASVRRALRPAQLAPIPVCVLFVVAPPVRRDRRRADLGAARRRRGRLARVGASSSKLVPATARRCTSPSRSRRSRSSPTRSDGARCSRSGSCSTWPTTSTSTGSRVGRPGDRLQRGRHRARRVRGRARHRAEPVPRAAGPRARGARSASGVCFVIWMLAYSQRQKETVETDLRRSEERLRALVEHASDAIMVLEADGEVVVHEPGAAAAARLRAARPHRPRHPARRRDRPREPVLRGS